MNNNQDEEPSKFRLFFVVIFGNLSSFTLGTCIAWPLPMMPKLKNQLDDSPFDFPINRNQEERIFAMILFGAKIGAVVNGKLADIIGRKKTMIVASSFFIAAYATTSLVPSSDIDFLYLGRLLQGFGAGSTMTVIPMYVGEISTKDVRGSALSLMTLFMTLGMLYVYCIGPFTHYLVLQTCCLLIPILTLWGNIMFVPESPYFLVSQGQIDEALESLQIVRGQNIETVKKELPAIQAAVEDAISMTMGNCRDVTINPANRRAMIISVGLMVFQQFSGAVVIVINSQSIFILADINVESAYCSIIVAVVQVCSSTTHQFLVDSLKRRTLLRWSALGMGIAHFILGTYLFVNGQDLLDSHFQWLPLFAFILFQFSYSIGFGPLPLTVLGELFPPNIKAIAATLVTITCWGLGSLIAQFYPELDAFGSHFVFWTFSIICGSAFLFAQFVVMETHGYTLTEIQERLKKCLANIKI